MVIQQQPSLPVLLLIMSKLRSVILLGFTYGEYLLSLAEEVNRKANGALASITLFDRNLKENLLREGYDEKDIFVTGNWLLRY